MKVEQQLEKLGEIEKNYKREKESAKSWREGCIKKDAALTELTEKYKDYNLEEFVNLQEDSKQYIEDRDIWRESEISYKKKITVQKREITRLKNKLGKSPLQILIDLILAKFRK